MNQEIMDFLSKWLTCQLVKIEHLYVGKKLGKIITWT